MYADAQTHSPFKGCLFDCVYCRPSFQAQAKRQLHNCRDCYDFKPHEHPERLGKFPRSKIVFMCGSGDVSFCRPEYMQQMIDAVRRLSKPEQTVYFQSKNPLYLMHFDFPENVVLVTTLETNKEEGYGQISRAPPPWTRQLAFKNLRHPRKIVTVEPIMKFDLPYMEQMIREVRPEAVWVGFNSKPGRVNLPEPTQEEADALVLRLSDFTEVRRKTMITDRKGVSR